MTSKKTKGFTIVELLTVMSIIIILMSILMPGLQRTRRYARVVVQRSQFGDISKALELYRNDHQETYPDSGPTDNNNPTTPNGYCGAMKLCEALVGQDGMGFDPSSSFQAGTSVYLFNLCLQVDPSLLSSTGSNSNPTLIANLRERTKYLDTESIKPVRLEDLYSWYTDATNGKNYYSPQGTFHLSTDAVPPALSSYPNSVLTDAFLRTPSHCDGKKVGMPILYYKADTTKIFFDPNYNPNVAPYTNYTTNPSIYNFDDNHALTGLGCPWESAYTTHQPMHDNPQLFYKAINNTAITSASRPHNEDTYILMSAGWDGLYGTGDDIYNFSN